MMESHPEIVLYDLACTKDVCFSPTVWRVRLLLNYKKIPYTTEFIELCDIESTLKELGVEANNDPQAKRKYTVPTIRHLPTNTFVMDSAAIAEFLEAKYADPPFQLTSELGREIELKARTASGKAFVTSIVPREVNIFTGKAQEYFRRSREAEFGCRLEDFLVPEGREDQVWSAADTGLREVSDLLEKNKKDGPFVLGARPSGTDFFIAGSLQSARVVDESIFERIVKYPGFIQIYDACLPWMERNT